MRPEYGATPVRMQTVVDEQLNCRTNLFFCTFSAPDSLYQFDHLCAGQLAELVGHAETPNEIASP